MGNSIRQGVLVYLSNPDGYALICRRFPDGRVSWAAPGGELKDDIPEEAAKRILREKLGLEDLKGLTRIGKIFTKNPGRDYNLKPVTTDYLEHIFRIYTEEDLPRKTLDSKEHMDFFDSDQVHSIEKTPEQYQKLYRFVYRGEENFNLSFDLENGRVRVFHNNTEYP